MRIKRPTERWFPMVGDPDNSKVLIKHLTPGDVQDIADESMPKKYEYDADADGKLIPKMTVGMNTTVQREMTFKACIKGWENFFDEDGGVLECTPGNIVRASREIEGFNEFITKCQKTLADDISKELKVQEKNLSSSASGLQKSPNAPSA